jgi:hypothetical protein
MASVFREGETPAEPPHRLGRSLALPMEAPAEAMSDPAKSSRMVLVRAAACRDVSQGAVIPVIPVIPVVPVVPVIPVIPSFRSFRSFRSGRKTGVPGMTGTTCGIRHCHCERRFRQLLRRRRSAEGYGDSLRSARSSRGSQVPRCRMAYRPLR